MTLVLLGLAFALVVSFSIISMVLLLGYEVGEVRWPALTFDSIVIGMLVAPFLSAFLFQYLPLKWVSRLKKPPYFLVMLVASAAFGLMHFSSPVHIPIAFLIGLYMSLTCLVLLRRGGHPLYVGWLFYIGYHGIKLGLSLLLV